MREARRSARKSAKTRRAAGTAGTEAKDLSQQVQAVLASLERLGSKRYREGLARYGIHVTKAFGVPVGALRN